MAKWRRAARVDDNQAAIVAELRQISGVTVEVGHDDILVGYRGRTYWFEVKRPDRVRKDGKLKAGALKESQKDLAAEWRGHYRIVTHTDEILVEIGATT